MTGLVRCTGRYYNISFSIKTTYSQTVKAFLGDMMLANRGHIVNIASMAGWLGCNRLVDYCSSKFAAIGFDEALRMELKVSIKLTTKRQLHVLLQKDFFFQNPLLAVYKAPLNSYQLHFMSNETSERAKMGIPGEDFDGKVFKNAAASKF